MRQIKILVCIFYYFSFLSKSEYLKFQLQAWGFVYKKIPFFREG